MMDEFESLRTLAKVVDDYQAPPPALYARHSPTRHLAVEVRLFIDLLVERFQEERHVA